MSLTLLPAQANLVEEVALRVQSAAEPADAVVVFPGKRPAHFLRQSLARQKGSAFVPPRILSMDELVDQVFQTREAREGRVRPRAEPIDAVAILYEIQLAAASPLGGSSFMTLDAFFPLGLRIQGDLEELLIEDVQAAEVAGVQPLVEEAVPLAARQRLLTLGEFYQKFYAALSDRSLSTRSSRYLAVSRIIEEIDFPEPGPVIVAGFFTLTKAEQAIFNRIARWPRAQLVFQDGPGMRERLRKALPFPVEEPVGQEPGGRGAGGSVRPEITFTSSPDTHGQVFALNAALESPEEDTLVVLPAPETLFPLLRHCLSRFDAERYNISLPYPLDRTPLYGFFNALMEVVGTMDGPRVYLPAYVSFVLHPYVKNVRLGSSAEATRVLFHALEERLEQTRTRRFLPLEEIESDGEAFILAARRLSEEGSGPTAEQLQAHLARIHDLSIRRFRSFQSIRDFAGRCLELLGWVHDQSTARDHPLFTPFSESVAESLEAIARSLMAGKSFADLSSYFTLLRTYLRSRHVSFPGTPLHGMQVLGGLETRGLQFSTVYILDANEGSFPEAFRESTLLPFAVRQALGLSTSRDQEDIAAYHFQLLCAGARSLHLFTVDGADRQRSRFVERLLWEEEKKRGVAGDRGLVRPVSYRVTLTNPPPAAVPKTPEVAAWLAGITHSATSLDAYLQCPLKFYYKTVLRLSRREELSGEIEALEIGTLVHSVLAAYFAGRTGRPLTASDLDLEALRAVLDRQFSSQFGSAETGANRLLRDQVNRHLGDFLTDYLAPLVQSHRVEIRALEHDAACRWKGFPPARAPGHGPGTRRKTGPRRLQDVVQQGRLPHEAGSALPGRPRELAPGHPDAAASGLRPAAFRETGSRPAAIQAQFLILGRARMDSSIELPLFEDPGAAHESWAVLEKVLQALLEEIVSADVPFSPARDLRAVCPRCDFTAICGTGWLKRS